MKFIKWVVFLGIAYALYLFFSKHNNLSTDYVPTNTISKVNDENLATKTKEIIENLNKDKTYRFKIALLKWALKHPKEVYMMQKIQSKSTKSLEKVYLIKKTSMLTFVKKMELSNRDFDTLFLKNNIDYEALLNN